MHILVTHTPETRFQPHRHLHYFIFALLLFPGLALFPFILFADGGRTSALLAASLLLANLFLPPKPNLASFFERFVLDGLPSAARPLLTPLPLPLVRRRLSVRSVVAPTSSRATSKRSSSFVVVRSAPCRSVCRRG